MGEDCGDNVTREKMLPAPTECQRGESLYNDWYPAKPHDVAASTLGYVCSELLICVQCWHVRPQGKINRTLRRVSGENAPRYLRRSIHLHWFRPGHVNARSFTFAPGNHCDSITRNAFQWCPSVMACAVSHTRLGRHLRAPGKRDDVESMRRRWDVPDHNPLPHCAVDGA